MIDYPNAAGDVPRRRLALHDVREMLNAEDFLLEKWYLEKPNDGCWRLKERGHGVIGEGKTAQEALRNALERLAYQREFCRECSKVNHTHLMSVINDYEATCEENMKLEEENRRLKAVVKAAQSWHDAHQTWVHACATCGEGSAEAQQAHAAYEGTRAELIAALAALRYPQAERIEVEGIPNLKMSLEQLSRRGTSIP